MKSTCFDRRASAFIGGFILVFALGAQAQSYPSKSIRLVVAFPPGGFVDFAARGISQRLAENLNVPVVIENRGGAGGTTGADIVAKAAPDGYTLLATSISHTINLSVYKSLPYDTRRDFAPIMQIADAPNILVVHPSLPVTSVQQLIALARAKPGAITYASSGVGTSTHLAGELFKSLTQTDLLHVPYKGGGPAVIDLVGGHVQAMFATLPSVLQHARSGKLRGLAVTGARRFAGATEFPTIAESGVPGYEVSGWSGLFAPAGTPKEIIDRLVEQVSKILLAPETKERFIAQGAEPSTRATDAFARFVDSEIDKWKKVVEASRIKAD